MPELPEVETIKRELRSLVGKKISRVNVIRKAIVYPAPQLFKKILPRKIIGKISRLGKYLIFDIDGYKLIFHFRLSGKLIISKEKELRYSRLWLYCEKKYLHFVEPRALGRAYLIKDGERPHVLNGLFRLGPEPFDRRFTPSYLKNILSNRRAKIKNLMLDQSIIAGLGNIYSDEALFMAGISPLRSGMSLTESEVRKLHSSIKKIIKKAINCLGTSISDYKRPNGSEGRFQSLLKVYHREGLSCFRCHHKIQKIKAGSRSWRYCPFCQK